METATIFFALAAAGGVAMALMVLRGRPQPPTWLAMLHGVLALTGVVLLARAALMVGVPVLAQIALGLFVLAGAGGAFINVGFHQKQKPLPRAVIAGHAATAVLGFLLLLAAVVRAHS